MRILGLANRSAQKIFTPPRSDRRVQRSRRTPEQQPDERPCRALASGRKEDRRTAEYLLVQRQAFRRLHGRAAGARTPGLCIPPLSWSC
jgi:hypothetical protein